MLALSSRVTRMDRNNTSQFHTPRNILSLLHDRTCSWVVRGLLLLHHHRRCSALSLVLEGDESDPSETASPKENLRLKIVRRETVVQSLADEPFSNTSEVSKRGVVGPRTQRQAAEEMDRLPSG